MGSHRFLASVAAIAGAAAGLIVVLALFDRGAPSTIAPASAPARSGAVPLDPPSGPAGAGPSTPGRPSARSAAPDRAEPARPQEEAAPADAPAARGHLVCIFAQADKEAYELGEPVRIRRILENPGNAAVALSRPGKTWPPFGTICVSNGKVSGSYTPSGSPDPSTHVEPGGRLESELVVELPEPGEYAIDLHFDFHVRLGDGVGSRFLVSVVDRGNALPIDAKAERIAASIAAEREGDPGCWGQADKDLESMGSRAVPHLRRWLRESPSAHLRAVSAKLLWFVKGKEGIEELVGGLKDPDAKVRETCLESLRRFKEPWTLTAVLPLIEDPDEFVRYEAIWTASEFEDSRVVPALKKALADAHGWVRGTAAIRLADRGDASGIRVLIEVIEGNPGDGPDRVAAALEKITGVSFGKAECPYIHSSMDRIEEAIQVNREISAKWLAWWEKEGRARFERK